MGSYFRDYFSPKAHERATVGDIKMSFTTWDHLGWLNCDGRSVPVASYYLLWQVVGYEFGGSGANFNLPDMRGRVPGAPGTGPGPTTYVLGDSVGTQVHTLTIAEMPAHKHGSADVTGNTNGDGNTSTAGAHTHAITDNGHSHSGTPGTSSTALAGASLAAGNGGTTSTATTGITIQSAGDHNHTIGSVGGGQAHNNMQPTLFVGNAFIYCGIRSRGSYPYTLGKNLF